MLYPDVYKQFFRCYPVSQLQASEEKKQAVNYGGKIYLPPSALSKLTTMRISYPMLFEIRSSESKEVTHGGVLEFVAPEGRVFLPEWMMQRLSLRSGALVEIRSTSLELGSLVKLEPQSVDFLEISDPKAVLENSMRNFSALTEGDILQILYNSTVYEIRVLEVKPETEKRSICVIETDLSVDFAPPIGYEDPGIKKPKRVGSYGSTAALSAPLNTKTAKAYHTAASDRDHGIRLSGKEEKIDVSPVDRSIYQNRDAPALNLPEGQLFFGFPVIPVDEETLDENNVSLFKGAGQALRDKDKRKR